MKIRTSELTGPALDWAVAKCRGFDGLDDDLWLIRDGIADMPLHAYTPSTDWAQGGPIIEREKLCVGYQHQLDPAYVPLLDPATICWARTTAGGYLKYGPTPLIAAMRCLVASRLGDEVDVPEELCTS